MYILQINTQTFWDKHLYDVIIGGALLLIAMVFLIWKRQQKKSSGETDHSNFSTSKNKPASHVEHKSVEEETPLSRVAETLDLTEWEVKLAVGIPITAVCNATTAADAEEEFRNAESNSDEEFAAAVKWIKLESDINKMEMMHGFFEDQPYLLKLLYEKWDFLAQQQNEKANSEEEIIAAFENAPFGQKSETVATKMLYELYSKE